MPWLEIELHGPLLVGGRRAPARGIDQTTLHRFEEDGWVPYIPATALRGAVRMQLEALLRGAGREATTPYPLDEGLADEAALPDDRVARIFGYSGRRLERAGGRSGRVRLTDAMPCDGQAAARSIAIRPGVEIDDRYGTAEDHKLYHREVADPGSEPLHFRARLDHDGLDEDDLRVLRAAVETTTALGAAKASGGGYVAIRWVADETSPPSTTVVRTGGRARRARITLRLREPMHLGAGGPIGNYQATRTHVPGSTLRGAIAWALIRRDRRVTESPGFQELFVDEERRASFGDALAAVPGAGTPVVVPVTRRKRRPGADEVDLLPSELARQVVHEALEAAASTPNAWLRGEAAEAKLEEIPARPAAGVLRTVRTRVSIDRELGTAAEGRLFSIEQIEAASLLASSAGARSWPTTFVAEVRGLTPLGADLLASLDGVPLLVGAGRHHGLGAVSARIELDDTVEDEGAIARSRVERLTAEVTDRVEDYAARCGVERPQLGGDAVLALVAMSDFVRDSGVDHPLAGVSPRAGQPVRTFLVPGTVGGYDQRKQSGKDGEGEPLKPLHPAVGVGSIYVYRVPKAALEEVLEAALGPLADGVGGCRESGCGRFAVLEPEHRSAEWREDEDEDQDEEEPMSSELNVKTKNELVAAAERIAGKVGNKDSKNASQLRNLLQVSQTESEVPVLRNFIRYQAARKSTKDFWQGIHQDVIEQLEAIGARNRGDDEPTRRCRRDEIVHFFGYLVRAYVYESSMSRPKSEGKSSPKAKPRRATS